MNVDNRNAKKNPNSFPRMMLKQPQCITGLTGLLRRFFASTNQSGTGPDAIFRRVAQRDLKGALELCGDFASAVKLPKEEFLSRQCSERSYLIYRLSVDSRADALNIAQAGSTFPDDVSARDLLVRDDLWDDEVKEQYRRAVNCIYLSRAALELGSQFAARDYHIIGKSIVWKLLFGRSACVLQTYLSRKLQQSRKPHDFALANHRRAASLFDEHLAPPGPEGPLEKPDCPNYDPDIFKKFSDERIHSANEHMRLIVHLTSDVARHVLARDEGKALIHAAEGILFDDLDDENEKSYASGVLKSTLRAL